MTMQPCKAGGIAAGALCERFLRHIHACHNAVLPGGRLSVRLGGTQIGWLAPALVPLVAAGGTAVTEAGVELHDAAALQTLARHLARAGILRWRDEAFDVRATAEGPSLGQIDRGALPPLGLLGIGVHVNGLVRRPDGLWVWVARRSAHKALDPGKLDHLVAGGVPAGLTPAQTLVKEAAEEAGLPADLAAGAVPVATLRYAMDRPEGLRRDVLVCYDLLLPEAFQPVPADGEVESFALWPIGAVAERLRDTDDFKFNVALVLIDLLLRCGVIDPGSAEGRRLRGALDG